MCISPMVILRKGENRLTKSMQYKGLSNSHSVPCGKCHECLGVRRNAWAFRLWQQMQVAESAAFITLTYEDEPLTPLGHGTLRKQDVQKFLKRLRKRNNSPHKIKYYLCGEYGSKYLRPHYHLIIFNVSHDLLRNSELLEEKIWTHGRVDIAVCNMATITYTVGYVMKGAWTPDDEVNLTTGEIYQDDRLPEFSTQSKGLGLNYLTEKRWDWHLENMIGFVTTQNGSLLNMPRYYKQKIFSPLERLELAQEAEMIRNIPLDWWTKENEKIYYEQKDDSIRRHHKEQLLKRLKL